MFKSFFKWRKEQKQYDRKRCERCNTFVDKYLEDHDCSGTGVVAVKKLEQGARTVMEFFKDEIEKRESGKR